MKITMTEEECRLIKHDFVIEATAPRRPRPKRILVNEDDDA